MLVIVKPLRNADSQQIRYVGLRCNMASAEIFLLLKLYIFKARTGLRSFYTEHFAMLTLRP